MAWAVNFKRGARASSSVKDEDKDKDGGVDGGKGGDAGERWWVGRTPWKGNVLPSLVAARGQKDVLFPASSHIDSRAVLRRCEPSALLLSLRLRTRTDNER